MADNGKIALITGAGSGIGAITCRSSTMAIPSSLPAVTVRGWSRPWHKRDRSAWCALIVRADVTDETSVRDLFEATKASFGRLDVLFNNAGIVAPSIPLEELTVQQWRQVVDVNLTAPFFAPRPRFGS